MFKIEKILLLDDTPHNRAKTKCLNKFEVMADDFNNDDQDFWNQLDSKLEWGKYYKITIEEIQ
jgi:hypothetical protein